MWRVLTATLFYTLVAVQSRVLEGPLWPPKPQDLYFRTADLQRNDFQDTYNSDVDYDLALSPLTPSKRALTMLSRWGPLSSIGKQRTPIRSNFVNTDSINTQTRGRMQGQPLRWG